MNAKLLIAAAHLAPCELSPTMVILRWEFFLLCFMKISNSKSSLQISFAFEKCFYRIGLGFYFLLPCLSPNDEVLEFPRSGSAVKLLSACHFCEDSLCLSLLVTDQSWKLNRKYIHDLCRSDVCTYHRVHRSRTPSRGLPRGAWTWGSGGAILGNGTSGGGGGTPRPALLKFSMSWRWEASLRWGPGSVTASLEKGSTIATRARDKWRPFHSVQNATFKSQ